MKPVRDFLRWVLVLSFCALWIGLVRGAETDSTSAVPPIIQAGFTAWSRDGAPGAIDVWRKGGLIEGDRKIPAEVNYFKRMADILGGMKGFELIQAQPISPSSQVLYLSINFERAAVYARFLLYRTGQDWVVQNMDFNVRPEMLIPWMALPATPLAE